MYLQAEADYRLAATPPAGSFYFAYCVTRYWYIVKWQSLQNIYQFLSGVRPFDNVLGNSVSPMRPVEYG